jgi:hypothetical protein
MREVNPRRMVDVLIALVLVVVGVFLLLVVGSLFWHPERNIDRSRIAEWLKSFMRMYVDGSRIVLRCRSSARTLEIKHVLLGNGRCALVVCVPAASCTEPEAATLERAALLHESVSVLDDPGCVRAFMVQVSDIWSPAAAHVAAQVVHRVLDNLGVGAAERFDLEFSGAESLDLAREFRRRLKAGQREW